MAFQLKSFETLVSMTREKLDEAMLPLRVRAAKAKAEGEIIKIEEKLLSLETKINEACAKKELDFNAIGDLMEIKGDDCARIGANYIMRQAREVTYDIASKYGSATIHTERTKIAANVVKQLQDNLNAEAGKGLFLVASANVRNLVTDPALEADIKAAAQAQFKLNNEKNLLEVTKVQAERKREEAKGEADAIKIKAAAVSAQGGKEYVELKAIEKWDGKLPITQAGGAVPFVNLK